MRKSLANFFIAMCSIVGTVGCAHLPPETSTAVAVATSTPTPTSSSSPVATAACGTQATNAVYIAMSSSIAATNDPTYGPIFGYGLTDSTGTPAATTSAIIVKPNDVVQFYNAELSLSGPNHSAVGFPTAAFPSVPYTFPAAAATQTGTTFSSGWSTGRIPDVGTGVCFSQAFTVPSSGTYYFGDIDFYNLTNFRDVIVVSTAAAI